ncbi:hypothetical protein J4E90_008891 [Alternaria incomplexa]|uniref:uncharacterized protein n=1 Tax=Alternaria incomplexa TaxID=1187928 RepID=UPI00222103B4|nr:uncharacterized protein J4E90_008891 [Alternaria incomplexa]KAI4908267.1 hypothetical protein J4E90_008891 [Alternaria incomplexa]
MDIDNTSVSIDSALQTHERFLLRTTSTLALAILLSRLLSLSHAYRAVILLCVATYILVFALTRYSTKLPSEEDDTPPPDVDITPTLSRKGYLTMQTSPTFERVRGEGEATPTKAVVWPKSQAWKNGGKVKMGAETTIRGELMGSKGKDVGETVSGKGGGSQNYLLVDCELSSMFLSK